MWLVEGKTTVAELGAMERGEDLDQGSNAGREFYVEDEIDDSLFYVREPALGTESASNTLSSNIVKQEIARWVAELEQEIDKAEQLCNGLREAIVEQLVGCGRFEVLQDIGQVLRTVTTTGTEEQREQQETQQKLRIARVRLLTDLFLHREPVTGVAQRAHARTQAPCRIAEVGPTRRRSRPADRRGTSGPVVGSRWTPDQGTQVFVAIEKNCSTTYVTPSPPTTVVC